MKKKLLLLPLFISVGIASTAVNANCPHPLSVVYKCDEWMGHRMCTWNPIRGWYQGSSDKSASVKDGDHLPYNAFKKALWFPYKDEQNGATNCFYVGPEGESITLVQKTGYGSVPKPSGRLWKPSTVAGFPPSSVECTVGSAACQFEFGERG